MKTDKITAFEERIPADLAHLPAIQEKLEKWLQQCKLMESETFQWKLILTEAVTNAIRHGCKGIENPTIRFNLEVYEKTIAITVQQPGPGPDIPGNLPATLPDDPLSERGRGLFIIEQFADEIEHWHGQSGYQLIVRKHYPETINTKMEEEMQDLLSELSSSYESLSAYNRLGQQILEHESLTNFVAETIEDLKIGHSYKKIIICPSNDLPSEIRSSLVASGTFHPHSIKWKARPEQIIWDNQTEKPDYIYEIIKEDCYGMITPVFCQSMHIFDAIVTFELKDSMSSQSVSLFTSIAELLGLSVGIAILQDQRERQIRQQREWEIATQLQQNLLPIQSEYKHAEIEINLFHKAAGETAGDYAIVCQSPNNEDQTYLAIIDVMGKGIRAALLAILFRGAFQLLVAEGQSPDQILSSLNKLFCNMLGDMVYFITAVICRFDKKQQIIEWANAGHCNFLGFSQDTIHRGTASGPPIGIVEASSYSNKIWDFKSVEHLALFTDGCYEWDRSGEVFDLERFENFLHERCTMPKKETWENLLDMIKTKINTDLYVDDITLILCTITNK